ncbi:VOC family protein [Pseudarthrobacter sp. P1]|uniref:VOC family protein n=1 Tax=Pseudarthrobacter sp. P1 TaxID=3418418 RepID=UPI003CF6277B
MDLDAVGRLHHVEIWVQDYARAKDSFGWMLERLGYGLQDEWGSGPDGGRWQGAGEYIVLESGPDVAGPYQRLDAGMNHLAFHSGSRTHVDALAAAAIGRGWTLMFADKHPYAGGAGHYAAYLENADGFEVELVAATTPGI